MFSIIMKGMYCPACHKSFTHGENPAFNLKAELNCPHCNARLQNPKHLRSINIYLKMILTFVVTMVLVFYLFYKFEGIGITLGLITFILYILWLRKLGKLKNGFIEMEIVNE